MSTEDATRVYSAEDRPWIPLPHVPKGAGWIKVIHTDEDRGMVLFRFRFSPGCELTPHTHKCHAVAYTTSGEWEYEGLKLPEGAVAYEPVESTHTPKSESGAELFVVLNSDSDEFLVNDMPDGSKFPFDMAFFKRLQQVKTEKDVEELAAELAA